MCSVIKFYIASCYSILKVIIIFLPGATIHICKQTQISPLTVDYLKDRHLNLSNCITLHNLLSGVLKNNSPSM